MKRITFSLLIWLYSTIGFSAIDERKTDIFFANGILTDREIAKTNTFEVLKPSVLDEIFNGSIDSYNQDIGKVDYAYNHTHGFEEDIVESARQITGVIDKLDEWFQQEYNYITSHRQDLHDQIQQYKRSIRSGHKVLVVAHSQGNLFTTEAYKALPEWMQNYFEAISIASPDFIDVIKPNTPEIGWDNDMVAWLGRGLNDSGAFLCNVRQVYWEIRPHLIDQIPTSKPQDNYVEEAEVGTYHNGWWKAVEGWRQKLDSNVHAFAFYMGQPIVDDGNISEVFHDPFTDQNLTDDTARKNRVR